MKVDVVGTTLVAPSEDTPRRELWLSNLDLAVPKTHTPLVYYYPAPAADGAAFFAPERLEAALARALVPFYPLAGRLGVGEGGRLQIDCDAQGALFVVARADFAGDDVFNDDYEPSPEVRRMFVPFAASGDPPCVMAMFQGSSWPPDTPIDRILLHRRLPPAGAPDLARGHPGRRAAREWEVDPATRST